MKLFVDIGNLLLLKSSAPTPTSAKLGWLCLIAKLSLNSTQLNSTSTQAEFSFILRQIQPPTHPSRIVVKWDLSVDFKYFNWRLLILQLKSSNIWQAQSQLKFNSSSASTQLNHNSTQPQLKLLSLALLSSTCFFLFS